MIFKSSIKVRFSDVDKAGIVYYPRFLHFFHVAFEDFFDEYLQAPYADVITRERIGFPAVHIETDFVKPLRFGELVKVGLTIESIGSKSLVFVYRMTVKDDADLRASGKVTVAAVDLDAFKAIPIPPKYLTSFQQYVASNLQG